LTEPAYIVGIDLGTTNSVVAYTEADVPKGEKPDIRVLEIPQLTGAGVVEKQTILPSFILLPTPHDVPPDALKLPWSDAEERAVGQFAKERGAELPQKLIASAKSWLCHTLVDRNKPILPWDAPEETPKLSPVEAAAEILKHIRDAWNYTIAGEDENLRIETQEVLLTVPASFDAVARDLTVKAAEMAGLNRITLLEEPQAAFYAWIESSNDTWRDNIERGDLVLVFDVGGGTSDFSLIQVDEADGELSLERVAVGDHLLVGGDNMDLTLAYAASRKLSSKKAPDAWQMRSLWHACRKAKEALLSDPDVEAYTVTVLGRGSKLIGGTKKVNLDRDMVRQILLDGFFPRCDLDAVPESQKRFGIQEVGLAYESDPGITRHLASFLSRQHRDVNGDRRLPTAILFNGGVMKPEALRSHLVSILSSWAPADAGQRIREIPTGDFDLSVARGAAYYGLARKGDGIRIRGGLNRTYYIGVAASLPAVPGMPVPIKALCVAPFGMEEGTEASLPDQEFVLVVGEPVKFDFLGSSIRIDDEIGQVIEEWEDDIEEITTIEATLDGESGTTIPVILEVRATEIGTLEIWCVAKDDAHRRWKLEFNVREQASLDEDEA
jgi:hypothetical protein